MAEVSASKVMELRGRTGLGMMECKKALLETGGDISKAEDLLRIKSGAKASKAADRVAAEGVIGAMIAADGKTGAMVELNCETDFVARNTDFVAFASKLAQMVAEKQPADVAALSRSRSRAERWRAARQALVQKLGENVSDAALRPPCDAGAADAIPAGGGRIGVMVAIEGGDEQTGKDIAMHVAASVAQLRPICVSREQVPKELIDSERAIYTAQAAESGKPADIVRENGRGQGQPVSGRGDAARAAVREGPRADRGEVSGVEGRDGEGFRAVCGRRGHRPEKG